MKVIDTHVHFWHPQKLEYAWIKGNPVLDRIFVPMDLQAYAANKMPDKLVFVEAGCDSPTLDEVGWIESLAKNTPYIAGIVAHAPLEQGDAAKPILEQLADKPLVKGVRRLIQSEALGFCTQPDFIKGVQALPDYGLSFDICIYHPQMEDVITLVKQCPQVSFILDHIGKPAIKDNLLDPWREHITTLARLDNVSCKISGMVTEADHRNWTREQLKPYIDHILKSFGMDRVMFGSDWPVLREAGSYTGWHDVLAWALDGLSTDEKTRFYSTNAENFYRLK